MEAHRIPSLLAAVLLLAPAPSLRAEDAAGSDGSPAVEGDRDGDGALSRKETRQLRRAQRRARRGAGESSDEPEDAAEAAAVEASQRGTAASSRAASAASALKGMMTPAGADGAPAGPGAGAPPGSAALTGGAVPSAARGSAAEGAASRPGGWAPSAHSAGASGDPSKPAAPADFVLAARGGYAPAFAKSGLKLSADGRSVLRLDGSPATAEDYARLGAEIRAMPAALGRRADFFSVISPGRYAGLKTGLKENPELTRSSLKDAGLTPDDRDIVHTRSCSKVEGGCNESVKKGSYKKGDFVEPEDLDRMWEAMEKELGGGSEEEPGRAPSLDPGLARAARERALAVAGEIAGGPREDGSAPAAAPAPPSGGVAALAAAAGRNARRLLSVVAPSTRGGGGSGESSVPAGALAAVAALAAAALLLRRRR